MSELLDLAIAAHGGLERWDAFDSVSATIVSGGQLWAIKGVDLDPAPHHLTMSLHEERTSLFPFGSPDWGMIFTPERISIEARDGAIVAQRGEPRHRLPAMISTRRGTRCIGSTGLATRCGRTSRRPFC